MWILMVIARQSEQTVDLTLKWSVIWDAIWRSCDGYCKNTIYFHWLQNYRIYPSMTFSGGAGHIRNSVRDLHKTNKANLRDLIVATGLVFLLKIGFKSLIFGPMRPRNLMEDLKNNTAPPLYYVKLCASFQSHRWIQTGVTVRKYSIWGQNCWFLSPVTSKFDRWAWKTIGHIFSAISSFVHHFITMYEFKMELQSGNTKFGSKSAIFFVPCYLEIWQVTLKNNRAPLLCYFKLCALFHSHPWIQSGVTVRKLPWGFDLCDLALWALTLTSFHDDTMMGT